MKHREVSAHCRRSLLCVVVGFSAAAYACSDSDEPRASADNTQPRFGAGGAGSNTPNLQAVAAEPAWAVPHGREFWSRAGSPTHGGLAALAGSTTDVDLAAVIERVSHAFRTLEGESTRVARSQRYEARLVDAGVVLRAKAWTDGLTLAPQLVDIDGTAERDGRGDLRDAVVRGDTAQREVAHGIVEHWRARERGVELTWLLHRAPSGGRDFTARLGAAGVAAQIDREGVAWLAKGSTRARVHPAQFVDSNGVSTPVAVRVQGDALEWTVPASVLALAAYPVALDPLIEPEQALDGEATTAAAPEGQTSMQVASNGSGYLVVWRDYVTSTRYRLMGSRLTWNGTVQDPLGIVIAEPAGNVQVPRVASNGTDYLVVWDDTRSGARHVYGARVRADTGAVLDPNGGFVIAHETGVQQESTLVYASGLYYVAWADTRSSPTRGYGNRINAQGQRLDGDGVRITSTSTTYGIWPPQLGTNGSELVIVYPRNTSSSGTNVYAQRVSLDLALVGSETSVAGTSVSEDTPSIAWSGTKYLVAFRERQTNNDNIKVKRLTPTLGSDGTYTIASTTYQETNPAVGNWGGGFLVLWTAAETTNKVYARRVSSTSSTLGTTNIVSPSDGKNHGSAAVASMSSGYLAAWYGVGPNNTNDGFVRTLDANGAPTASPVLVTTTTNNESAPAIAANGTSYLVAWEDDRNSHLDIVGVRLGQDGTILDPTGLIIAGGAGNQQAPTVAAHASGFIVAWEDTSGSSTDIAGAMVSSAGAIDTAKPGRLHNDATPQTAPSLASTGAVALIAYASGASGSEDIGGRVIDATGTAGAELALVIASDKQANPTVASDGVGFLVAYEHLAAATDVRATRVSALGSPLDASPGFVISSAAGLQHQPAAGFGSGQYVVAWRDERTNTLGDIYAARVTPAGTVLDTSGISIATGTYAKTGAAVACDSEHALVVWQATHTTTDIEGAALLPAGVLEAPGVFAVSNDAEGELLPAVASVGLRRFATAYRQDSGGSYRDSQRLRARLVHFDADGDGYTFFSGDCDDGTVARSPGAPEACDAIDSDCDGSLVDTWEDTDQDGTPDCTDADDDDDGVSDAADNCDFDANPSQLDANSNGLGDVCEGDADQDGALDAIEGRLARLDPNIRPGAVELCDQRDNDGDGLIDEGTACEVCQ